MSVLRCGANNHLTITLLYYQTNELLSHLVKHIL